MLGADLPAADGAGVVAAGPRNHPALPGYLDGNRPDGFNGYTPGPEVLDAARRYARSFTTVTAGVESLIWTACS